MALAISICVAVLITFAVFPKEFKSTDLSPVIFFLGLTLVAVVCYVNGVMPLQFTKGPNMLMIGAGMLLVFGASGTTTFKVLTKIPASAYKSLAPAAICVGAVLILLLTFIL